ncbi:DUF6146 family protein [Flavobacterium cerinum]|uniref:Uncharacterized protein n=1 Tax=Flavobacterium cerinum TaxID=2502784 RepID=A0A3S3TVS3_9FLAO|nr:DUF6146 family protein [Flavobacterium cerinum]RWW96679.1 hypothetical protein EPI11_13865 [Flavobacterium cerinum]
MRTYLILITIVLSTIISCTTQKNLPGTTKDGKSIAANDTVRIANDSLEYEVIIIDPGFTGWLASRAKQRGYYGQSYLENKNRLWVMEWNNRALNPLRYGDMYSLAIDYQPAINYGYEVNYLLYNYLVYFQISNRQKLAGIVPQF